MDNRPGDEVELVVRGTQPEARVSAPGSDVTVRLRARGAWSLVPGESLRLRVAQRREVPIGFATETVVELVGEILDTWTGPGALGPPLQVRSIEGTRAERRGFALERPRPLLSDLGGVDPCDLAARAVAVGHAGLAYSLLNMMTGLDVRALDAHAGMGDLTLALPTSAAAAEALRHFSMGVAIGDHALGAGFSGELPWREEGNQPFLTCLLGHAICCWRLERIGEAADTLARLLRLDPLDGIEAGSLLEALQGGRACGEPSGGLEDMVDELREYAGGAVPSNLRRVIIRHGPIAVPLLRRLMTGTLPGRDPVGARAAFEGEAGERDGDEDPSVVAHAAELLIDLGAVDAIEGILAAAARGAASSSMIERIGELGPDIVGPALRHLQTACDPWFRHVLEEALARTGMHDERIFAHMAVRLERLPRGPLDREPEHVHLAAVARDYGDPRAVPLLGRALDRVPGEPEEKLQLAAADAVRGLATAIESLGGILTPVQREKLMRLSELAAERNRQMRDWTEQLKTAAAARHPSREKN